VRLFFKSLRGTLPLGHVIVITFGVIAIVASILASRGVVPIPAEAAGPMIGTGITLLAMGISELLKFYSSTTKIDYTLDLEKFDNSYRVSALIHNPGNIIVKDAKAVITVETKPEELQKMLTSCKNGLKPLVNQQYPRIEGEALAWALPEKPIKRPIKKDNTIIYTDYTHITSISPHQRARLLLFDFVKHSDGYLVEIFSEYGAPGPADPAPRYKRACLNIAKDREIRARVYVSGEGLRKPLEFCLKINERVLDSIVKNPKEVENLGKC